MLIHFLSSFLIFPFLSYTEEKTKFNSKIDEDNHHQQHHHSRDQLGNDRLSAVIEQQQQQQHPKQQQLDSHNNLCVFVSTTL